MDSQKMKISGEHHKTELEYFPNSAMHYFPLAILFAMGCALFLLDAVLPLRDLGFTDALLTRMSSKLVLPTRILFPGLPIGPALPGRSVSGPLNLARSWEETALLLATFVLVFLLYLAALRHLPQRITQRYIFVSTLLLGIAYMLIPIVTSADVFSYIFYARIGAIYYHNPLTTLPNVFPRDPFYSFIYWRTQPSAYGPTWAIISCSLQWLANHGSTRYLGSMVLILRLLGLCMHLCSTWLIWSIIGYLQTRSGHVSPRKRLLATLAFAWNPLLLLEACVNAHIDATMLSFVLLAIWFLVRKKQPTLRTYMLAVTMLALATCIKINIVLLASGLLLFMWIQQPRQVQRIVATATTYLGMIILLYAPFWQDGMILHVLRVNPATGHSINTPADFLGRFYHSIGVALGYSMGSSYEIVFSTVSIGAFIVVYGILCWKPLRGPRSGNSVPNLIRWMAVVWLLYCILSPWFWPWYTVTFFGLHALIETTRDGEQLPFDCLRSPLAILMLAFSMLSLYCCGTWGPVQAVIPGLSDFHLVFLRGLWAWTLPLLLIGSQFHPRIAHWTSRLERVLLGSVL